MPPPPPAVSVVHTASRLLVSVCLSVASACLSVCRSLFVSIYRLFLWIWIVLICLPVCLPSFVLLALVFTTRLRTLRPEACRVPQPDPRCLTPTTDPCHSPALVIRCPSAEAVNEAPAAV
ncbi:hypothetical protein DENSPDRAFT_592137 [Dentipellis sp. KUC8613]|nr:hypothetical protein DENSPDRAFT_592137 [Dentipellis sp. KUC8613]